MCLLRASGDGWRREGTVRMKILRTVQWRRGSSRQRKGTRSREDGEENLQVKWGQSV